MYDTNWYLDTSNPSFKSLLLLSTSGKYDLETMPYRPAFGTWISLNGYLITSSFLIQCFRLFLVTWCSTIVSLALLARNLRMNLGSHSSEAIPRSLQQRIRAFDLHPSVAVGIPSGSKYCCSPRAMDINLRKH